MSKRIARLLIEDIIESVDKIFDYIDGMTFQEFMQDNKTIDSVVRNFEIIGEAANRIPDNITEKYSDIEWCKIIAIRNRVVHEYFGVDYEIIWHIIINNLQDLRNQLENILKNE
ncbi:MAG: DUF86 domain-containing protein [Candidatus Marinimicrobia bacterium]|nr:DUF86 domain-containing protein [Candidatus Neomarinimicrobiota bacterium]